MICEEIRNGLNWETIDNLKIEYIRRYEIINIETIKWINNFKTSYFILPHSDKVIYNGVPYYNVPYCSKFPVLIQGETSVGKTSLITWLAKSCGHVCLRINNHEHTDLQEYIGCYAADLTGKLVFQEGT